MRIISFSHAPMQAFWSAPVQALAPWINRIRHSLGSSTASSLAQHFPAAEHASFVTRNASASNDAIFDASVQTAKLASSPIAQGSVRCKLRVVRESDADIKPDCAGRMVISGRMADVCAELDRMAQQATDHSADA